MSFGKDQPKNMDIQKSRFKEETSPRQAQSRTSQHFYKKDEFNELSPEHQKKELVS
jgi:hypothetical protein